MATRVRLTYGPDKGKVFLLADKAARNLLEMEPPKARVVPSTELTDEEIVQREDARRLREKDELARKARSGAPSNKAVTPEKKKRGRPRKTAKGA